MSDKEEGIVKERLNMYFLLDSSGSMGGAKIQQLNDCMTTLKPVIQAEAKNEGVDVVIRALEFGSTSKATWHTGNMDTGKLINDFIWQSLKATGGTPTASAIEMVTDAIDGRYLGERALRPVVILVSDGGCTDGKPKYTKACQDLVTKHGDNVIRVAIGVDGANIAELEEFASKDIELNKPMVFKAKDAADMVKLIRWVSQAAIKTASKNPMGQNQQTGNALPGAGKWIT
ncbi:MAG: VWA domain-containing protein [Candidatus Cloacimonetes bacterium]|nr:VWA domain-containing protein [Candidatus Cloacimonadota bacterium]